MKAISVRFYTNVIANCPDEKKKKSCWLGLFFLHNNLSQGGENMKDWISKLKTANPSSTAEVLGFAIDVAIIENTLQHDGDERRIDSLVDMMNKFTICRVINITYDGIKYQFTFEKDELIDSLYIILGWVIDNSAYAEYSIPHGFKFIDNDGITFKMEYEF